MKKVIVVCLVVAMLVCLSTTAVGSAKASDFGLDEIFSLFSGLDKDSSSKTTNEKASSSDITGLRSEFKQAMDDYEAFYDKYVDVMDKVGSGNTGLSVLAEYAELVAMQKEIDESFEKWDGNMNDAETKYYLEVQTRVLKNMASIIE